MAEILNWKISVESGDHGDNADYNSKPYGMETKFECCRIEDWGGKNQECHVSAFEAVTIK